MKKGRKRTQREESSTIIQKSYIQSLYILLMMITHKNTIALFQIYVDWKKNGVILSKLGGYYDLNMLDRGRLMYYSKIGNNYPVNLEHMC